ncbi:hypothetical protein M409DRAFT_23159 [Zasmidium cellare ATCC 36951]|uniref:Amino acid permease/ SLC12A domain-containing protein n=1 Tax=Zasmidium cellare ATCC 36951 TaxID=1080233 RepID=A0A6A6CHI4_ZASCE|nr:uncharacterized protein M409DRAFT_23159 [Zasmidium cellare ATCC 36951]KAF2166521.1 hypothetical protein M409DRAFT_23159 [Zasmidium cellare ATCC 36951]
MDDIKEVKLSQAQELPAYASDSQSEAAESADEQLATLGYKPELRRVHSFWTLMAFQTTILCSWSCNIVVYDYIFTLGGVMSLVWSTILVGIGQTLLMASLAEYAGIWPQAGGQQFLTQMVAPEKMRRFLSYVVGWAVLIGEISTSSSCAVNSAQILAAFIEVTHPDVVWKPWMTFLVYLAFLIGPVVTNLAPGFPTVSLSIWSADFVFTEFMNTSGWNSKGWVFILSMYVPIYGLYGTDSVMHLVEEMKHPARDAPRVMVWSMVFSSLVAWISAIIMGFTTGNWAAELETTQPYFTWFINVTKSVYGGGIFCAITMMGLNYLIIVHTNTAGSRLAWRMAKDGGFPFAKFHSHNSKRFGTPLRPMFAVLFINAVAGTLVMGSDLAFWALISGGGITLQIAYAVPIICVVCRGREILPPRPYFDLGRWGYLINWVSLGWSVITLLFYSFPQYVPVVGNIENMNWASAIVGGCVVFCALFWVVTGRHTYMKSYNSVVEENIVVVEGTAAKI